MSVIMEPHEGKLYPSLPGVAKIKGKIRKPLKDTDPDLVDAYGRAVLDAIGALQAAELRRETPTFRSNCASGTWHSDGKKILAALRQRTISTVRILRSDEEIQTAYEEAMEAKREAAMKPKRPPMKGIGDEGYNPFRKRSSARSGRTLPAVRRVA